MEIKEIKELLELIGQTPIEEFEMERAGVKIRIRKHAGKAAPVAHETPSRHPEFSETLVETPRPTESKTEESHIFKAPIVGTFYASPKPDAEPFIRVGDRVQSGTVLCIIEAMKIFNQIESDIDGEIARILVDNGQPVEYGEPLFEIRRIG